MKMPAGQYYIGDLCYVMHDEWDEVCELFFAGRNDYGCNQGKFKLKDGREFVSFNTMYGDGSYFDKLGYRYDVDAGLIGCIAVDNIKEPLPEASGFRLVTFTDEFECDAEDGILFFGGVHIDTDPDPEWDEEDEEEY